MGGCNTENKTNTNDKPTTNHNGDGHDHGDHDHDDHDHGNSAEIEDRSIQVSEQQNSATTPIINSYIAIKNALVKDDKSGAAEGGEALLKAFSDFDMTKLTKEQHTEYMDIMEDAKEQTEHIIKSPIDHQREHFEVLSVDIKDLIALVGTDQKLYEVFCPMANEGKGAIWISEIEDIQNPFFGNKMLKCGEVQERINE